MPIFFSVLISKVRGSSSFHVGLRATALCLCLCLIAAVLLQNNAWANLLGGSEPLPPDVAFKASISSINSEVVSVRFDIADGYYLYRDKIAFETSHDTEQPPSGQSASIRSLLENSEPGNNANVQVILNAPAFSQAQIIEDEFFGEQAVFRSTAAIDIPYRTTSPRSEFTLSVSFQGCADIGLCYPPTVTALQVDIPSANQQTVSSPAPGKPSGNTLVDLVGLPANNSDLLPPEQAYVPQLVNASTEQIDINWEIKDGYYLYRNKLDFSIEDAANLSVSESKISEGTMQHDEFFGDVEILRYSAQASVMLSGALLRRTDNNSTLVINYQGCADIGVCFPPSIVRIPLQFVASATAPETSRSRSAMQNNTNQDAGNTNAVTVTDALPAQSEQDRLFNMLGSNSLWLNVATFFGLGLLLAFTPCVLPMVPILSSLIVGQGETMSTRRAFQLSLIYVLVMASTYAVIGVIVGLSGYNVQAFLQNPWVLTGIALLFVALSLSMFGFYELRLPAGVQTRLTQWSNRQGGGQASGVAAMGFVSTLIVGPCVTAPLAGALIYIAKTGDAVIGGAALFALGLGMGAPLLLIGTSAGKFLPRAGVWMTRVNHAFGILLLAMAVYMVSRFLPATITMSLFGVLAVMSGVYLGATDNMSRDSTGWQRFSKGTGIVVTLYGVALLVGALAGGGSYTKPLGALATSEGSIDGVGSQQAHALPFQPVKGPKELQRVLDTAKAQGRPVMLDFYADWCISCKEMEAFTFTDQRVQDLLSRAIVVQADVTKNDSADQALLKKYDLFGPPGIIFYNVAGEELRPARVVGFMNADDFAAHIERFIGGDGTSITAQKI
ncbi:MAG: protein-disulfide reductase DsbD [Granulosicoccus sp.]